MAKKNKAEQYGPTRRHFKPELQAHGSHMAATAAKSVADACAKKLGKMKRELKAAVKEAHRAETKLKRIKGSSGRKSHSTTSKRKSAPKRKSQSGGVVKSITAASILKGAAKRSGRNKTWVCSGPVRTGCGGSTGKVAKGRKACP